MANIYPKTWHTAGTTYSRAGFYALPAGTWSAAATVKTSAGVLVETLSVNISALGTPDVDGNTHALSLMATATQTALWPLAPLLQDIIFTDASSTPVKVPADTIVINVAAHTPPINEADNPLQVITPAMAPVLRGADGSGGGGGGSGNTNLTYTASPTNGIVTSDSGTDAVIPAADVTNAGLMLPAEKTKLAAIAAGATANSADATLLNRANHTGTQAATTITEDSTHRFATDAEKTAWNAKQAALGFTPEVAGVAAGLDATVLSTAQSYADSLVVGLVDDRGNYNASGNTFPASGGSGTAGAVLKGDLWTVSVAGTLGGVAVTAGDLVRALTDAPGQTAGNWAVTENKIGYVPTNAADKDATGGYAGLTAFKLNLRNALGTITSWFTTAATAARTWTMPDKDGTIAMTSDIPATTDALTEGSTNLYSTAARIRATVLTGLSTAASTVVTATHTILEAIGFLQKQVSDNATAISGKAATGAVGSSGLTMATNKLLGRGTAATGAIEEITLGTNLSFSGGTLNAAGGSGTKTFSAFSCLLNQPPASSFATLDTRNSIPVLDFDATADESAIFSGVVSEAAVLTSGIVANIVWMATSATSGNVRWRVAFERRTTDQDSDSWDTATEATSAANGTSGICSTVSITCTTIDSIVAGDSFRVRITRVGSDGTNDTMTGDAELVAVELRAA